MAGAIARQMLEQLLPDTPPAVSAYVERVQDIAMPEAPAYHAPGVVDATPVRCPHPETAQRMIDRIGEVRKSGDTIDDAAHGGPVGFTECGQAENGTEGVAGHGAKVRGQIASDCATLWPWKADLRADAC